MSKSSFTVKFKADMKALREGYKILVREQKNLKRKRKEQIRFEKKASREEVNALKKLTREKIKAERLVAREKIRTEKTVVREKIKSERFRVRSEKVRVRAQESERRQRRSDFNQEGRFRRASRGLARGAAFAGAGLIGLLVGGALSGYRNFQTAVGSARATVGLGLGFTSPRQASQYGQIGSVGRGVVGQRFGYNAAETQALMAASARATGTNAVRSLMRAEAYGLPTDQAAAFMSAIRHGGTQFEGEFMGLGRNRTGFQLQRGRRTTTEGRNEIIKTLAKGLFTGLEMARMPEFFNSVTMLMQQQQAMTAGRVTTAAAANVLSILGSTGVPGLQGQRGGRVAAQLQQGIMKPGGGMAGIALVQQAFGFGKPGGTASFYEARKFMEEGFGAEGEGLEKVMREIIRQGSSVEEMALMMQDIFGTNLETNEELLKVFMDDRISLQDRLNTLATIQDESKSLEEQAVIALKANTVELQKNASLFNQSLKDGATAAKGIQKLETLQREFFNKMIQWTPKVVQGIKDLVILVKDIKDFFGIGERSKAAHPIAQNQFIRAKLTRGEARRAFARGDIDEGFRLLEESRTMAESSAQTAFKSGQIVTEPQQKRGRKAQFRQATSLAAYNVYYRNILRDVKEQVGDEKFRKLLQKPGFRTKIRNLVKNIWKSQPGGIFKGTQTADDYFYKWVEKNQDKYNDIIDEPAPEEMIKSLPPTTNPTMPKSSAIDPVQKTSVTTQLRSETTAVSPTRIVVIGDPGKNWHEDATTSVSRKRADGSGHI